VDVSPPSKTEKGSDVEDDEDDDDDKGMLHPEMKRKFRADK
jgi:hypothetical protein